MHLAYYDESGDDGFPDYSSPLFVLTTGYIHHRDWQETFTALGNFRKELKERYGIPVKFELHTRPLLLNKRPFRALGLPAKHRAQVVEDTCRFLARMPIRFINVAVLKPHIERRDYKVLDRALTYSIQRVENDLLSASDPGSKFLIITDQGREGTMRKTCRRIRRINYIPSHFGPPYRREITSLIEDPLPKDSRESHFIQMCDLVAYLVYLYGLAHRLGLEFPRRLGEVVSPDNVRGYLEILAPCLNRKASSDDPFGVVFTPRRKR